MFTRLTCKGLDICPLPADVRDSCFRGGAGARDGKCRCLSVSSSSTDGGQCVCLLWHSYSSVVGQAAVAQAWEHGNGRGGMAMQLARSATAGRSSVGSPVS